MKPAPCLDCLIIPICRQRYFIDMKNKCKLVGTYLFKPPSSAIGRNDFDIRINRVYDAIKPVHWNKRHTLDNHVYSQSFKTGESDDSNVCFPLEIV